MTVPACRAASPTGELPLHRARVYNGAPLPTNRGVTFTSSAADLQPIEDSMRAALAFGGNATTTGFTWDFEGNTEDYSPLVAGSASHTLGIHGPAAAVPIGTFGTLQTELALLNSDPVLAGIFGGVTLPPLESSPLIDDFVLALDFGRTDVAWLPATSPAAPNATLHLELPLIVSTDLDERFETLFNIGPYEVSMPVDIDVIPCGDCTDPAVTCNDAPSVVAAGYRTAIASALGYAPGDRDAVNPDMGLNLVHRQLADAPPPRVVGGVSYTAACPFVVSNIEGAALQDMVRDVLDASGSGDEIDEAELAALLLAFQVARSVAGFLKYIVSVFICNRLTSLIDPEVRPIIAALPGDLDPVVAFVVNPPALTRPLATLPDSAAGLVVPGVADVSLSTGAMSRAVVQIELAAAQGCTEDFECDDGIACTIDSCGTSLCEHLAPDATCEGREPVLLTGPSGGYTDALFNTTALGGSPRGTATLNLEGVTNACGAGVGLTPEDATACGLCNSGGACAVAGSACAYLCSPTGGFLPTATVPTSLPLNIANPMPTPGAPPLPSGVPTIASLLSTVPLFGETIRRWFSTPIPAGARYTSTSAGAMTGSARLTYVVDVDDDCAPDETDTCRGVFDPLQVDDGDGDIYGAVCDRCPGVNDSSPDANLDHDGDGLANACDCDRDGDGCVNEGASRFGACTVAGGAIYDRAPRRTGAVDFDRDGINDDCDNDRDEDGVLEEPFDGSAPDNCPLGNGDGVYEMGLGADQDPDQTDSGGVPAGDICDVACPGPGVPACDAVIDEGGGGGGGGGYGPGGSTGVFDGIAGLRDCLGLASGSGVCDLSAFLMCPGADYDRCWLPDAFDSVILVGTLGNVITQIDAAQMNLVGGFASSSTTLPDIDGDGRDELVLAAPRTDVCPEGKACFGSPGVLTVFGSERGKLITRVMAPEDGSRFGTSMARLGDVLAVGAPFAAGGRGSVYFYRVSGENLQLLEVVVGEGISDALGTDVAPAFGADTTAPSFLIGAPGARARAGRMFIANASQGITHRYDGPLPGAGMSQGVVVGTASNFTVVGAMPAAAAGRGALAFFSGSRPVRVRRGTPGARLGERVVVVDGSEIVAAAPGAGAVLQYTTAGALTDSTQSDLPLFGTGLSAPGDLDGDGLGDLIVGFGLDSAGVELRSIPLYRR